MEHLLRTQDLEALLAPQPPPCLSLYLPTERHHPRTEQNPIRLKNLLRKAEELLSPRASTGEVRKLLETLAPLGDPAIWRSPSEGLAAFACPGSLRLFRSPFSFPELVSVSDTFHVRPLLRLLTANRRFLVLSVSLKRVGLHEATAFSFTHLELERLPTRLEDVVAEKAEPVLNLHHPGHPGGGAVYHGQGTPADFKKEDAVRFFRAVDDALCGSLRDGAPPLVLAGTEPYLPIYRDLSRYPNLVREPVDGSFEHAPAEELHARALAVAKGHFARHLAAVKSDFQRGVSSGQSAGEVSTIARATVQGRVRSLLLAEGEHVWGRLDRDSGDVAYGAAAAEAGEDDILDELAECVLLRGGEVLLLERSEMPSTGPVAAVLRW